MDAVLSTRAFGRRVRSIALVAFAMVVVAAAGSNYLRPVVTQQADTQGPQFLPPVQTGRGTVPLVPVPSPPPIKRTVGFIKGGAISVLIEQFGGMNDQPPMRRKAFVQIKDSAVINILVRQLNALPAPPALIYCPLSDDSYFALTFAYASRGSVAVKVEAVGCGYVFVGGATEPVAWTLTSPVLLSSLQALTAHPPGSY